MGKGHKGELHRPANTSQGTWGRVLPLRLILSRQPGANAPFHSSIISFACACSRCLQSGSL